MAWLGAVLCLLLMCGIFCGPVAVIGIAWYWLTRYRRTQDVLALKAACHGLCASFIVTAVLLALFIYGLVEARGYVQYVWIGGASLVLYSIGSVISVFPIVWAISMLWMAHAERRSARSESRDKSVSSTSYVVGAVLVLSIAVSLASLWQHERSVRLSTETASPNRLRELSRHPLVSVRAAVACNPRTPVDVLQALSWQREKEVLYQVALNPNSPPDVLRRLSSQGFAEWVAMNSATPTDYLRELSKSGDSSIRSSVARNRNTLQDVLLELSKDSNQLVRLDVIFNPSVSDDILKQLESDSDPIVVYRTSEMLKKRIAEKK